MKEKRRAESVNHLSLFIHAQSGVFADKIDLPRITAAQGSGDFGVVADGVFTEGIVVIVNGHAGII